MLLLVQSNCEMSFDLSLLNQYLEQVLGHSLSLLEFTTCHQLAQILYPDVGQCFWQSSQTSPGLYVLLKGKVRLVDTSNNLLCSISAGSSFGERTWFSNTDFQAYGARASLGTQLYQIQSDYLRSLMRQHPQIRSYLYHQAIQHDLGLICIQALKLRANIMSLVGQVLPLLKLHVLQSGESVTVAHSDHRLWLLRTGQLKHSSGLKLESGQICGVPQLPQSGTWSATSSTELYVLNAQSWEQAIAILPELTNILEHPSSTLNPRFPIKETRSTSIPTKGAIKQSKPTKSQVGEAYFPTPIVHAKQWWQRTTQRYPFVKQQSAADCGIACLVMIGQYWGKDFKTHQLRLLANVTREGTSLRGLNLAAESIGLLPRPIKAQMEGLSRQPLPLIGHWKGNHYIVVYQIKPRHVIVVDPAVGQRILSHADFQSGWTGYAVLLQPTASFQATPENHPSLWKFLKLIQPHSKILLEVLLAAVTLQFFGLVTPILTQLLLDQVITQRSVSMLTTVGTGLLIFGFFRVLMASLRRYLLAHTANKIDLTLIVGFISHALYLPLSYFESRYVGDLTSRIEEARKIRRFLTGEGLGILLDLLTVFGYVSLMFWYSWQLALLGLSPIPFYLLLTVVATPFVKRISREIFNAKTTERSYLIEVITGINTVKAMGVERPVRWQWEDLFNRSIHLNFAGQLVDIRLKLLSAGIEMLSTTALLCFGVWQVIQGRLTIGQLIAFNMILGNVISPFRRLIDIWNDFQETVIAIERMSDVAESKPEQDHHTVAYPSIPSIHGHICFEQVTFRYSSESERNTLENLSFEVFPGQMVAIVGRSGSGKTTITKLLLGLYASTQGRVLIDGYDVTSISLPSLRQQVGVVAQDIFLFGGTIRQNISVAFPGATMNEITQAAKLAGADQFIQELPMKYETLIGEGGSLLSGGQRQRLAISRALLGNPKLLILDEATSNLDAESEQIIQTNLSTLLKDRTTLIIAHRLSTVRRADLILVLDRGVLVESGTHETLLAQQGQYFYLNQQQLAIAH
jgi:HlyB family type I secretion system ABC transporter